MKNKNFKPLLAPNEEVDLSTLKYPLYASYKLDGIRCIFYKGEILSRSLKQIQNKQLREKFEEIRKYTEDTNSILDGEIYSPKLTFQEITHFVMTQDLEDEIIPDHLNFWAFDCILENEPRGYLERICDLESTAKRIKSNTLIIVPVSKPLNNTNEVNDYFEYSLEQGFEGLILRDPNGRYKFGRGTTKEGIIYKVKPFKTFDAEVIGVVQATEVDPNAEKKINELGRSVTSKKVGDRNLIKKASAFNVKYEGKDLKVVLAMTDEEKEEVWVNKEKYVGRMIEYKGMLVGAKDVPRHGVFLRFRDDKNAN